MMGENTNAQIGEQIWNILGVERVSFEAKYLGLPTPEGHMKANRF